MQWRQTQGLALKHAETRVPTPGRALAAQPPADPQAWAPRHFVRLCTQNTSTSITTQPQQPTAGPTPPTQQTAVRGVLLPARQPGPTWQDTGQLNQQIMHARSLEELHTLLASHLPAVISHSPTPMDPVNLSALAARMAKLSRSSLSPATGWQHTPVATPGPSTTATDFQLMQQHPGGTRAVVNQLSASLPLLCEGCHAYAMSMWPRHLSTSMWAISTLATSLHAAGGSTTRTSRRQDRHTTQHSHSNHDRHLAHPGATHHLTDGGVQTRLAAGGSSSWPGGGVGAGADDDSLWAALQAEDAPWLHDAPDLGQGGYNLGQGGYLGNNPGSSAPHRNTHSGSSRGGARGGGPSATAAAAAMEVQVSSAMAVLLGQLCRSLTKATSHDVVQALHAHAQLGLPLVSDGHNTSRTGSVGDAGAGCARRGDVSRGAAGGGWQGSGYDSSLGWGWQGSGYDSSSMGRAGVDPSHDRGSRSGCCGPGEAHVEALLLSALERKVAGGGGVVAQDLSLAVWSLAVLGLQPSGQLLDAVCEESYHMLGTTFTTQGLANLAWGFAVLGYTPSDTWLIQLLAAAPKLTQCTHQELSNLAWALPKLLASQPHQLDEQHPQLQRRLTNWLRLLETQLVQRLDSACCNHSNHSNYPNHPNRINNQQRIMPQHVAVVLRGLALLQHVPSAWLFRSLESHLVTELTGRPVAPAPSAALVPAAAPPPPPPVTAATAAAAALKGQEEPQAYGSEAAHGTSAGPGAAALPVAHKASPGWVQDWSGPPPPTGVPQGAAKVAESAPPRPNDSGGEQGGSGGVGTHDAAVALSEKQQRSRPARSPWLSDMQAQCTTLWSLARLGGSPPASLVSCLSDTLGSQLHGSNASDLSAALYSLALLQHPPGAKWMVRFFQASRRVVPSCSPAQLGALLLGLARLRVRPEKAWMQHTMSHVAEHMRAYLRTLPPPPTHPPTAYPTTLPPAPHQPHPTYHTSPGSLPHVTSAPHHTLPHTAGYTSIPSAYPSLNLASRGPHWQCSPRELASLWGALGQLGYCPPASCVGPMCEAASAQLPAFKAQELTMMVTAQAKLGLRLAPQPRLHAAAVVRPGRGLRRLTGLTPLATPASAPPDFAAPTATAPPAPASKRQHLPHGWADAVCAAVAARAGEFTPRQLQDTLSALAHMRAMPALRLLHPPTGKGGPALHVPHSPVNRGGPAPHPPASLLLPASSSVGTWMGSPEDEEQALWLTEFPQHQEEAAWKQQEAAQQLLELYGLTSLCVLAPVWVVKPRLKALSRLGRVLSAGPEVRHRPSPR